MPRGVSRGILPELSGFYKQRSRGSGTSKVIGVKYAYQPSLIRFLPLLYYDVRHNKVMAFASLSQAPILSTKPEEIRAKDVLT